jgi:photosystem II stability/assembly factor-like uncharacterized protein
MKRLILFCITVFFIVTNIRGQWEVLNEGGPFQIFDFVSDKVGWIAGEGTLLKTEDGGETWNSLPIEEHYEMQMIDFIDKTVGYAVASDTSGNMILKSQDGGFTWLIQKELPDIHINAFHVVDDNNVYIIGFFRDHEPRNGIILKTSDGGKNWIDVSPDLIDKHLYSIWFFEPEVGVITGKYDNKDKDTVSGLILKTIDGGNTWDEIIIPEFQLIDNLQFINDSTGYFKATKKHEFDPRFFLCATTDTFKTWTIKTSGLDSYFILNDKTIFAVISDTVKKSTDGGISWENTNIYFNAAEISAVNSDTVYLIGYRLRFCFFRKFLWKTTNGGEVWSEQFFTEPLHDVWFFNRQKGFVCAGDTWHLHMGSLNSGFLYYTNDGGITWDLDIKVLSGNILKCFFINDFTGYIISKEGFGRKIYKTVDGGANWNPVYEENADSTGYAFWGNDICFLNEDIGWAVGWGEWSDRGACILGTTDGGENWDLVWKYPNTENYSYRLHSIHIVDTEAWAVGESGLIVKYTEQDQWQPIIGETDLPLNDVFFSDEQHGWIAGGYLDNFDVHFLLLKTINGGVTWQEKNDLNYQINDMYFADSLHGWVVGSDTTDHGMILETVDGGDNWTAQEDGLSAPLNALHFKDGYGWAVGSNGLVLRTEDGTNWVDNQTGKTYPNKFSLSQNYPNPFNPKTIINYELQITNYVELSIYNILGEKVAMLVSERQDAGHHQVEWDASAFASGVYYYQLRTKAGFIQTKKLVLLK